MPASAKNSKSGQSATSTDSRKRKASADAIDCNDKRQFVGLDCEFVGVGDEKLSALGRCSIVDYWGKVVLDIYAVPEEPITDYRTKWSGIKPEHMKHAIPFENARRVIKVILKDKIVVGHALHNDLSVLDLEDWVPKDHIRDTSTYKPLKMMAKITDKPTPSLKALAQKLLGRTIQTGSNGHSSVEDSRAAMDLYRKVQVRWENDIASTLATAAKRQRVSSESKSYFDDDFWPDDSEDEEYDDAGDEE